MGADLPFDQRFGRGPAVGYECPECGGVVRTTVSGRCRCSALVCDVEQARFGCASPRPAHEVTLRPCLGDFLAERENWGASWLVIRDASALAPWLTAGNAATGQLVRLELPNPTHLRFWIAPIGRSFEIAVGNHPDRRHDELDMRWIAAVTSAICPARVEDVATSAKIAFAAYHSCRTIRGFLRALN